MSARQRPSIPPSADLQALLERIQRVVVPADYETIRRIIEFVDSILRVLTFSKLSILRLKRLLDGFRTEKLDALFPAVAPQLTPDQGGLGAAGGQTTTPAPESPPEKEPPPKDKPRPGHGRTPATAYAAQKIVKIPHPTLTPGSRCPACLQANVSLLPDPSRIPRILGQAMLVAILFEAERLRCNSCGEVFTAPLPPEAQGPKYDEPARALIALLQYGNGFPGYRLARLQKEQGVPVPASVQWELNLQTTIDVTPIVDELIRQAAQASLLHNDDTGAKIIGLMKANEALSTTVSGKKARKGIFTTGIVAEVDGHKIGLYFTGPKHAGENLADILRHRRAGLPPPLQECDALSRNYPKGFLTLVANCLAHGRRKFVDVAAVFPGECKHVLDDLAKVYHNDELAKQRGLSPEARLRFHQAESGPVMAELHAWLTAQLRDKAVEPNSALGRAMQYLLTHWERLTLFLREPGVPLDNNICERMLKMAILRRKNALFYKTEAGAAVGDALMSIIQTCRLAGVNPFHYLTTLLKNRNQIKANPAAWMPWNYPASDAPGTKASFG